MTPFRRLALQYVLIFGATGATLPFAGLWLASTGMGGTAIGLVLALPMLARVVTGPLIAVWADGFVLRRTPMAVLGAVAALGYAAAAAAPTASARGLAWFVAATGAAALVPLTDVLNLRLAERSGFAFARARAFGSGAFVLANLAMGALLLRLPASVVVLWAVAAGLLLTLSGLRLPPEPVADPAAAGETAIGGRASDRFASVGRLLSDPVFMTAILAVGSVQAAHAFYYAFSAILWRDQGLGSGVSGALWAFSVGVEIAFMAWVEPWRRRRGIGPLAMLGVGAAAAVIRWGAMALSPPLMLLWPLQALHALSFAASFLAGVQLIERLAPRAAQTAAQTLASVISAGVLIGLATLVSGPLHDRFGAGGYWAMAGLAALGGVLTLSLSVSGAGRTGSTPSPRPRP